MNWKKNMQLVHTQAPPPNEGSNSFPAIGCIWKSSAAPASTAAPYATVPPWKPRLELISEGAAGGCKFS
jgi:hypothetical protein